MKNRKVPKLRFKEFTDGWEEKRLGEISELITKGTTPQKFIENGFIKYVKIESIYNYKIDNNKCLFIDEKTHKNDLKRSILKENDILFAIAGSLGKTAIISKENLPANTNQALSIIRLKKNKDYKFILSILNSTQMIKYIHKNLSIGAQPNLSLQQINDFNFNMPSLQEQQKIADFLSCVDTKISLTEEKLENLKKYKKGIMQKVFSQEIRFKDKNGNDYPEWEEKKLGEITQKISNGISLNQNFEKKGYKVTRIETISDSKIDIEKIGYIETDKNIEEYKLKKGNLLFSNINSVDHIGKVAYIDKDYDLYHGMNLLRIIFNENLYSKYFYYLLGSAKYKKLFEKLCNKAVSQASINQTELGKIKILCPYFQEQQKIADFLSSIDNKIEKTEKKLNELKEFKKGLLQKMFV